MEEEFFVQWHITNQCNLRCSHCYQDDFTGGSDLDLSGLIKVSDNLLTAIESWNKTACIHLTGGEPLLRPELFSLLKGLNRNPIVSELGIITNGLLIHQEMTGRLAAYSKLKKIKISLEGADPEMNDAIRSSGNFEKVIRNLQRLKEEGRFEVILMFTVMKSNYRTLLPFIRLCQDLDINGLILERFIPLGRGKRIIDQVLDKEEWKEFVETLLAFFALGIEEEPFFSYQAFQIRFDGEEPELLGAPCVIGDDGLCVMPDGNVFPCRRFPVAIGNLLKDSLKTIWEKSEILDGLRDKRSLKGKCGRCEMAGCRGCRSLAFALTGDHLAEDPHCWYEPEKRKGGSP